MGWLLFSLTVFPLNISFLIRNSTICCKCRTLVQMRSKHSKQENSLFHSNNNFTCLCWKSFQRYWICCKWFDYSFIIDILGILQFRTWKGYSLKRGPNYAPKRKTFVTDLTRENFQRYFFLKLNVNEGSLPLYSSVYLVQCFFCGFASYLMNWLYFVFYVSGEWKELEFKEYNYTAKGQPLEGGNLHPLLKARRYTFSFPQPCWNSKYHCI